MQCPTLTGTLWGHKGLMGTKRLYGDQKALWGPKGLHPYGDSAIAPMQCPYGDQKALWGHKALWGPKGLMGTKRLYGDQKALWGPKRPPPVRGQRKNTNASAIAI